MTEDNRAKKEPSVQKLGLLNRWVFYFRQEVEWDKVRAPLQMLGIALLFMLVMLLVQYLLNLNAQKDQRALFAHPRTLTPVALPSFLPTPWVKYVDPKKRFTLLFPGPPTRTESTSEFSREKITATNLLAKYEGSTYELYYLECPRNMVNTAENRRSFIAGAMDNLAKKLLGKVVRREILNLNGNLGFDIRIQMDQGLMFQRRGFLVQTRFYSLGVLYDEKKARANAELFLNSFQPAQIDTWF